MTLNDLERRNGVILYYFSEFGIASGRTAYKSSRSLSHLLMSSCCHSNETREPIANPLNTAQLWGTPYYSTSYIRVCAVVWELD